MEAGNLDTRAFLGASRSYFSAQNILLEERFDYDGLKISGIAHYRNYEAKKIIFCEGFRNSENPWFSNLPFKLTKGEVLTVRLTGGNSIPADTVINKGVFILPLNDGSYKVGSTYEWNELNEEITEKGKQELITKLKKILKVDFEIINHEAGIRPTVNDRRPILGLHRLYPELAVFNGMGTKGVMLAPYFANEMVSFLENKKELNPEVSIERFKL
jgi:glycine/D-amino acid oxidase-like deaminating enzyme